jgi:hypothetical protein
MALQASIAKIVATTGETEARVRDAEKRGMMVGERDEARSSKSRFRVDFERLIHTHVVMAHTS